MSVVNGFVTAYTTPGGFGPGQAGASQGSQGLDDSPVAPSKILYVPYDHCLLTEVHNSHLDWKTHLARVRV